MIYRFQSEHFALGRLKQLAHILAAHTEAAPIDTRNHLKTLFVSQTTLATDLRQKGTSSSAS